MGVIAAFFGTVFSGITGIFSIFLARKLTFSAAYIAIFILMAATFVTVITGLLGSITNSVPTNSFLLAGLSLLPSNTATCIGLISTAHTAAYVFKFKREILDLKVNS